MKIFTVIVFFLLAVSPVYGEKKPKVDPKDVKIDSLTKTNKVLTLKADSLTGELVKYVGVYNAIKEKVLHYNFDPTRASYLIDSLKAVRDAQISKLSLSDSVTMLMKEKIMPLTADDSIYMMKTENKVCPTKDEAEKARAVSSLKQLKDLLDSGILTESEFITLKSKYLDKL
jgi:hypothetical protein